MKYTPTHISVNDGSDVMMVSSDPFVLMNEDGYTWATEPANWRLIDGAKTSARPADAEYTEKPTHLRIYWEDCGDFPWCIDGADFEGRLTGSVAQFETLTDVLAAVPSWARAYDIEPEKEWAPMTLKQIKDYLAGRSELVYTETQETEFGIEYR